MQGAKLIGTSPDVLKFSIATTTDGNGVRLFSALEWDSYTLANTDVSYDIAGYTLPFGFTVSPSAIVSGRWIMEQKTPSALLVTVEDGAGVRLNDATTTLTKTGFSATLTTGRRSFRQTDWSGAGEYGYTAQSGNVETAAPAGELRLKQIGGTYPSSTDEWLISDTFDMGSSSVQFYDLSWTPVSQPPETGTQSIRFQIASNNDSSTWNYVGPDATPGTHYTANGAQILGHNGGRYFRYKAFLRTENDQFTPRLEEIRIGFGGSCAPAGQSYFSGLVPGTYMLTVEKAGYQSSSDPNVAITDNWQEYRAVLAPQ
jgi:hypothetical protein